MCTNPITLRTGQVISCRKCKDCRTYRINTWVGRSIAESKFCSKAYAVSLTYGRDERDNVHHARSVVLTYPDVQKMLKRLRKAGYVFKFICVGEYGHDKGRAHWHLILFFHGRYPVPPVLDERFNGQFWDHGFQFWQEIDEGAVRYVCKYVGKDVVKGGEIYMSVSKFPPIGIDYIQNLAREYARSGISPPNGEYAFPEVLGPDGRPFRFNVTGALEREYFLAFEAEWKKLHGKAHYPVSTYMDELAERYPYKEPESAKAELERFMLRRVKHMHVPPNCTRPKPGFDPDTNKYSAYCDDNFGRLWRRITRDGIQWMRQKDDAGSGEAWVERKDGTWWKVPAGPPPLTRDQVIQWQVSQHAAQSELLRSRPPSPARKPSAYETGKDGLDLPRLKSSKGGGRR